MKITDSMLSAYQTTDFRVYGVKPIILRIGIRSSEVVEALYGKHDLYGAMVITAWRAGFKTATNAENNRRLEAELRSHGLLQVAHADGLARYTAHSEPGFFVLLITREQAQYLCDKWEQCAVVFIDHSGVPELLFNSRAKLP